MDSYPGPADAGAGSGVALPPVLNSSQAAAPTSERAAAWESLPDEELLAELAIGQAELAHRLRRRAQAEADLQQAVRLEQRLTAAQIAQEYGISVRTWFRWAESDDLRRVNRGGAWPRWAAEKRISGGKKWVRIPK